MVLAWKLFIVDLLKNEDNLKNLVNMLSFHKWHKKW
jgi:hypothetical protein